MQLIGDRADKAFENTDTKGWSTGLKRLDDAILGFHPGNLYLIGGRSSMGKTSLLLDFALNLKVPTLFISIEMNVVRLQRRAICQLADLNHHRIMLGYWRDGEKEKLLKS